MTSTIHSDAYRQLIGRLTEARTAAGLTQQELAERLGRPQSFIAKVEGFERRLDVLEFLTVAKAMGQDPIPLIEDVWAKLLAPKR